MALQSTDGQLNEVDKLPQIPKPGTVSITNKTEGDAPTGKVITKDAQIIVNDGVNDRILIGFQANGF